MGTLHTVLHTCVGGSDASSAGWPATGHMQTPRAAPMPHACRRSRPYATAQRAHRILRTRIALLCASGVCKQLKQLRYCPGAAPVVAAAAASVYTAYAQASQLPGRPSQRPRLFAATSTLRKHVEDAYPLKEGHPP